MADYTQNWLGMRPARVAYVCSEFRKSISTKMLKIAVFKNLDPQNLALYGNQSTGLVLANKRHVY